jgi:hypothetical protein
MVLSLKGFDITSFEPGGESFKKNGLLNQYLKKYFSLNFKSIEVKPFGGGTSGMLWVLQEWIAILFSFGNKKLHMLIYLTIMVITAPLKFLDYFLIKHPMAKNISSGFVYIGKK